MDNFLGPGHVAMMRFWDWVRGADDVNKKSWELRTVAKVHHLFRNYLGPVDQSDVKSQIMKLTRERVSYWYNKQLAFLIESCIANAHSNYNLDSQTTPEYFTEWYNKFLAELLQLSPNLRTYKRKPMTTNRKRGLEDSPIEVRRRKRSHHKTPPPKRVQKGRYGNPSKAGLNCYGRENLAAFLRFCPKKSTLHSKTPTAQRINCRFCGRKGIKYKCLACKEVFCMRPPQNLTIPDSDTPKKFKADGPFCWHLLHGYTQWSQLTGR